MDSRIKELRKHLSLTQQEFADKLNIKRNTIASYETGRNTPIDAVVSLICEKFNVNEDWLRNGVGEMFIEQDDDEKLAAFAAQLLKEKDDSFKRRFISVFTDLSDDEWVLLEKFIDRIVAIKKED